MVSAKIQELFKQLEPNPNFSFLDAPRKKDHYLTHAYHRYPAKFIPQLASYLIHENSKKGDLICDPFGGCGTSLVEAKINGRNSIGIDINPLASLITKAKITPLNINNIDKEYNRLLLRINKYYNRKLSFPTNRLIKWFTRENLYKLSAIHKAIYDTEDIKIKRFLLCAFSHILKNTSKWLTTSIKPTIDKDKVVKEPLKVFLTHLEFMIKQNAEFYNELISTNNINTEAKFYLRDARKTDLPSHYIDYILTSPPYVTSYEYADLHQLSLFWLGFPSEWVGFKKRFIGSSHRFGKNKDFHSDIGNEILNELIEKDHLITKRVRAYFEDMSEFLIEAKRILKKNGKISIVIGNTVLRDTKILNAEVAYEQMVRLGFKNIKVKKREISFQSITPYRDKVSGRFTSISNPNRRRIYQFEYLITGVN